MEIFMGNLPANLTEDGLKIHLEPVMKQLHIVDFLCEKPKKKSYAFTIFLHHQDGARFLAKYAAPAKGNVLHGKFPKAVLTLMGKIVNCKLSNRQASEFALKTIRNAAQQRENPQNIPEKDDTVIPFYLQSWSCGTYEFKDGKLGYFPEIRSNAITSGVMKFTKRSVIVKRNDQLIRIPTSTIIELIWSGDGSIALTLSTVPLFFSTADAGIESTIHAFSVFGLASNNDSFRQKSHKRICYLAKEHCELVGFCLVYQFQVDRTHMPRKLDELKRFEITITRYDTSMPQSLPLQSDGLLNQMHIMRANLAEWCKEGILTFGILFQLQALAYNGYLIPSTVSKLAKALRLDAIRRKANGELGLSVDAIRGLFFSIDWPSPFGDSSEFEVNSILQTIKQNDTEIKHGLYGGKRPGKSAESLAKVCRVTITPSRVTLHGPELEPSNRILRKFPHHHEYFLRIQFCDENGQDIYVSPNVDNVNVYNRFKDIFANGIEIAGRKYKFLGFSHSSLRSRSVWFSAPFYDENRAVQTHATIIDAIGNFSTMTCPARCAARIGQAFSETPFSISLKENQLSVRTVGDVKSPDGQRLFSDGIGYISKRVLDLIWDSISGTKDSATCFQVRVGGAKGMLALDRRDRGSDVTLRESMMKFRSDDMDTLEICEMASHPLQLFLNRQIIKILEDMGVPETWFVNLQNDQLEVLREITSSAKNTVKFLKRQHKISCLHLHKLFMEFTRLDLDYKEDRFLRSIVEALVLRELRLLKHKARIPVEQGATLFGVMDETGYLKENEVFVTLAASKNEYFAPSPGPGRVLVTRSPALYDGDIQAAFNVIPPNGHPLCSHKNCIVFSSIGSRDLPSQLSGGDLDGDKFNVIWDAECTPMRIFPPADYPRSVPQDIGRPVTKDDMAEFFIRFMQTDRLGIIATRHMIAADQFHGGTSNPACKQLAELHSKAVDFSKTGIAVEFDQIPRPLSLYRPDFLAPGVQAHIYHKSDIMLESHVIQSSQDEDEGVGSAYKYYKSDKILGKLYRAVDEQRIWSETVRWRKKSTYTSFWDDFFTLIAVKCMAVGPFSWTDRIEEARTVKAAYENAVFSAMNDFSEHPTNPITELEVFMGFIFGNTGVQSHRQRARSIRLSDEFSSIVSWIMGFLRPHGNEPVPLTGYETEYDALALCLACVYVGGEKGDGSMKESRHRTRHKRLESFRIVSACALLAELELFKEEGREYGG